MWCIYTVEYNTEKKNQKNDISKFVNKWMDLENIILSEVTHPQEDKYPMYSLINGF